MTVFDIKEQALDALSQIEKQHLLDETGGFTTSAILSPYDIKSMSKTNLDLSAHANLLNQSNNFGGTMKFADLAAINNGVHGVMDGSFSNNPGQSFLRDSNFNTELINQGVKS